MRAEMERNLEERVGLEMGDLGMVWRWEEGDLEGFAGVGGYFRLRQIGFGG